MFGKQEEAGPARSQSLIQQGVIVRGDIRAEGDVRLEGAVEGTVTTKGRIIVGATGAIQADIEASEILVMGKVNGKILGRRRIELRKGAKVEGDLSTQSLVIEEGVFFQGQSQMNVQGEGASAPHEKNHPLLHRADGNRPADKGLLSSSKNTG